MSITPYQPTLPAEIGFTEAELNFMEESPPGLFPDNQNSNLGYIIRKLFSDQMQEAIDQVETLYTEKFVETSTQFLDLWEQDYGLPVAPTGKTTAERRSMVQGRIHIGPFSRDRVKAIIETYLNATAGVAVAFTPDGVPITAGGIPLFGEFTPGQAVYRVYEDIRGYTYTVWILNTITPDITGITRELTRITPSGIAFTIDNTKTDVLDYAMTVRNKQPVWYSRFGGNANDLSGYGNNGTLSGSPAALASPGLLVNPAGGSNAGYTFDGVNDYMSLPTPAAMETIAQSNGYSYEIWVKPGTLPTGTNVQMLMNIPDPAALRLLGVTNGSKFSWVTSGAAEVVSIGPAVSGTTYHVVGTREGRVAKLYVNGVLQGTQVAATDVIPAPQPHSLYVGQEGSGGQFFSGGVDEPALYNRALTLAEIQQNYNTGRDVA